MGEVEGAEEILEEMGREEGCGLRCADRSGLLGGTGTGRGILASECMYATVYCIYVSLYPCVVTKVYRSPHRNATDHSLLCKYAACILGSCACLCMGLRVDSSSSRRV